MDKHETTSKSRLKLTTTRKNRQRTEKQNLAIGDIHGDTGLVKRLG